MTTDEMRKVARAVVFAETDEHFEHIEDALRRAADEIDRLTAENKALWAVAESAKSVCSEEGVREQLSCYVMGVELIDRLATLPAKEPGK